MTSTQAPPPLPPTSPATPQRGRALPYLLGLLTGVVAAALVAGVLVVALGGGPGGGLGSGGDVKDLPDELDGVPANDSDAFFADSGADADVVESTRQRNEQNEEYNADRLGEVFDGAEIASRAYLDADTEKQFSVLAIGADAGPVIPFLGFTDPDVLGLAVPQNERTVADDVECLLTYSPVPEGDDDTDVEPVAVLCQRRDDDLSVRVQGTGGASESDVRGFTQAAWDAVS